MDDEEKAQLYALITELEDAWYLNHDREYGQAACMRARERIQAFVETIARERIPR